MIARFYRALSNIPTLLVPSNFWYS